MDTTETKPKRESPIVYKTVKELREMQHQTLAFEGKWAEFIGLPSPNFGAIIHGPPKNGKSTFALEFAHYLSTFGKMLYVSGEEAFNASLKSRCDRLKIPDDADIKFIKERDCKRIAKAIKNIHARFVIVDSAHHVKLTPAILGQWREANPKTSFIIILKSTKDGNYRGDTDWEHDVDVVISLNNGVATSRGRFAPEASMRLNFAKAKTLDLFNQP